MTLCPPEWNDVSLAENVVTSMRIAALRELRTNAVVEKAYDGRSLGI